MRKSRVVAGLFAGLVAGCVFAGSLAAQEMPGRRFEAIPVERSAMSGADAFVRATVIDIASAQDKAAVARQDSGGRLRVGSVLEAPAAKSAPLWSARNGAQTTQFVVRSNGAAGMRTRLEISGASARIEVRAASAPGADAETISLNDFRGGAVWTPYTDGDTQYIELIANRAAEVTVAGAAHFDISPLSAASPKASGACNPDVTCSSNDAALDAAIDERKKSVPLLSFMSGASSYICSGTLLNSGGFPAPFLLTANHCIATQTEASTLTTFWFKEAATCGALTTTPSTQVAGGAQLTFTNFNVDSTLLQLNNPPPAGAVYAGWSASPLAVNDAIVSISHPKGDPTKYALGNFSTLMRITGYPQDMYGISFTRGIIEPGSSGSGLFTLSGGSLVLRGVLSGATIGNGGLSCTNLNEHATYPRFEIFYQEIKDILSPPAQPPADDYPNQPGATAPDLPLGGSLAGNIQYAGDLDVFRVTITQPGTLTVNTTGGLDTVGTLIKPNGATSVANDDAETRSNDFGLSERVDPGVYYVSVGHYLPNGTGAYQVHASFAPVTDNYSDIWSAPSESGWGLALNHQGNTIAGALYTYDLDGSNLWLLLNGAQLQSDGSYAGPLLRFTGPAFNTVPWQAVASTQVGTMRLVFANSTAAQLTYTVNGVSVTKAITRFVYDKAPTCTFSAFDRSWAFNYQDVWWNSAEAGWGVNLVHQGDIVAGAIYTYDSSGRALWLLLGGSTRTFTNTSVVFTGDLSRYTGPAFNASPWPATATPTKVGTMSVEFTQGNKGKLTYTVNGTQVVKQIERFVFSSPTTVCN